MKTLVFYKPEKNSNSYIWNNNSKCKLLRNQYSIPQVFRIFFEAEFCPRKKMQLFRFCSLCPELLNQPIPQNFSSV